MAQAAAVILNHRRADEVQRSGLLGAAIACWVMLRGPYLWSPIPSFATLKHKTNEFES